MPSPAAQRIRTDIDEEGRFSLSWDVMGVVQSRLLAAALAAVAVILGWTGHSMPVEFWGLLHAQGPGNPDWLGLAVTGAGSLIFCFCPVAVTLVAFRIAWHPKPERLILGHDRLVYEPGTAALIASGGWGLPAPWRAPFGTLRYQVSKEEFGGADLGSYKGIDFVRLQMGRQQLWIGRWLQRAGQKDLVREITEWQYR